MTALAERAARNLPVGIQDYEKLREKGFVYVDKTRYIYELARSETQFFLSRPRRFGKSLFLSMLRAYWEGKRELFTGLEIERMEKESGRDWEKYPVFYFDFNRGGYHEKDSLEDILSTHLKEWEKIYGCEDVKAALPVRFQNLLVRAFIQSGRRCVVLVDEYDKPLLETMEDPEKAEHNKAVFKAFFSALKSHDGYLQFVLITGVTKFSKVSIFSDINQLEDISFDEEYAGICGITEEELRENFCPEIEKMAVSRGLDFESCCKRLRDTYDGYHFAANAKGVYNPYSLLTALKKKKFGSFWFETGTPAFLVRRLRQLEFDVQQFADRSLEASEAMLSDYRADNPDPIPLLYQTGYLTITGEDQEGVYILGFPNTEVETGFLESLIPEYVNGYGAGSGKDILALRKYLEKGNTEAVKNVFTALFASIPYTSKDSPFEHYFQTVLFIVFTLLNQYVSCEIHTGTGRADCVVETKRYVYLFEFKRDASAEEALMQIKEKKYALPYAADPRKLYKIGVNFDSGTRLLEGWIVE